MGRFWSLMFLLVPILGTWIIVAAATDTWPFTAPPEGGWFQFPRAHWFPENVNPHGEIIDILFIRIFYLTGAIFIGTGIALFWFLWKYDAEKSSEAVKFSHGNHTLEVVWSIIPALTLLFIAFVQLNAWADHKMRRPLDPGPDGELGTADDPMLPGPDEKLGTDDDQPAPKPPLALVTGRQFQWDVRYAGKDGELFTPDDLVTNTDLHVPVNEEIVLQIESRDVLHSVFLPNFRVKQDVVPGMTQHIWFLGTREGVFDIVCAELCGWGHYKMKGRLTVQSRQDFEAWLDDMQVAQQQDTNQPPQDDE